MIVGGKRLIELGVDSQYIPVWRAIVEGLSIGAVAYLLDRYYLKQPEKTRDIYLIAFVFAIGKVFHNLIMDKIVGAGGQKTMSSPVPGLGYAAGPSLPPAIQQTMSPDEHERQGQELAAAAAKSVNEGMGVPRPDARYEGSYGSRGDMYEQDLNGLAGAEYFPTDDYPKAPSRIYGIDQRSDNPYGYTSYTF
jgi:hypothetical protein